MKNNKRVLFVTTGLGRGGAERVLICVLNFLHSRGYSALVLSIFGPNRWTDEMSHCQAEVIVLTEQPAKFLRFLFELVFKDIQSHYIFIHGWMYNGNIVATVIWFLTGKRLPLFWSVRQSLSFWFKESAFTKLSIYINKVLSKYPKYISFNSFIALNQHIGMGFSRDRCCYLPNVFPRKALRTQSVMEPVRKKLGIPEASFVFGMFSRFHPVKDHRTCFDACLAVSRKFPNCYFLFAGMGVSLENAAFKAIVPSEIQNENFLFLGEQDNVAEIMESIDCLLLSSLAEGTPNIIGEAVIMTKPFISTRVGDTELFCSDDMCLVDPGEVSQLTSACLSMIGLTKVERLNLARKNKEKLEKNFSEENFEKKLSEILFSEET